MYRNLVMIIFLQLSMADYANNSFRSYVDKEPGKYVLPGPSDAVKDIQFIKILTPEAKRVEFHMYPNEHVVVLEGENLWFCHEIRLGENDNLDIKTPAQNVTRRMIQFSFPPYQLKNLISQGKIKVTLHSHFASPIEQNVQVMQVYYNIIIIILLPDSYFQSDSMTIIFLSFHIGTTFIYIATNSACKEYTH